MACTFPAVEAKAKEFRGEVRRMFGAKSIKKSEKIGSLDHQSNKRGQGVLHQRPIDFSLEDTRH